MAALTPVDATLSIGARIGRYFAIVSMIPSLFLVLWVYLLVASGSLTGTPTWHKVEVAISDWSLGKVAWVVLATLAVAVVLHPLQFVTTQLLEGYWGTTSLAIAAMKIRIVHHRKRQRDLRSQAGANRRAWIGACKDLLGIDPEKDPEKDPVLMKRISNFIKSKPGDSLMLYLVAEESARSQNARAYPSDATRILPTQLGNVLRSFEDAAGSQYGLSSLTISPHLHLLAPPRHLEYLVDAREDMDSAIRICTVGLIATILTVGLLLTDGFWLLWAILPYFISYLAYKGAVSAAQGYGSVIASVIDLDRFLLYDELGVPLPRDNEEERKNNLELMQLLNGQPASVRYSGRKPN
jgi:hypothetical protein